MTDSEQVAASTGKNEGSEPYKVGKGKPPLDTRFGGKRANPRGRKPKSFDQLRALAQQISHEPIADASKITVAEAILRTMAKENPARFVEIAFGKVPDKLEITQIDVDREIERELARVAARRQTKDAGDTTEPKSADDSRNTVDAATGAANSGVRE